MIVFSNMWCAKSTLTFNVCTFSVSVILHVFQDYDSMIGLVEKISGHEEAEKPAIQVQCAFALNRRNKEGDRSRALAVLEKVWCSMQV